MPNQIILAVLLLTALAQRYSCQDFPNCVDDKDHFLCIRILNGTNMQYIDPSISNTSITADSFVQIINGSSQSPSSSIIKTTDTISDITPIYNNGICFANYGSQITLRVNDTTQSAALAYVTLENIQTSIDVGDVEVFQYSLTKQNDDIEFITDNTPTITFQIWKTSEPCINATDATFLTSDRYRVNITFIELVESNNNRYISSQISYLTDWSDLTSSPSWGDELFCHTRNVTEIQHLIVSFNVIGESTGVVNVENPTYTTNTSNGAYVSGDIYVESDMSPDNWNYSFELDNSGDLNVIWVESCGNKKIKPKKDSSDDDDDLQVSETISLASIIFTGCVLGFGVLAIFYSCYRVTTKYPASDPVNFLAVGWLVLELFDFYSDVSFTFLLYYTSEIYFYFAATFLVVPYLANMYYLVHLLQIWTHPKAPGQTRHWLELWSWYFIAVSMLTGGVHPALEITNSVLLPSEIFGMHLPYHEIVRVRSERFITNVLCENIPHLLLQVIYLTFEVSEYSSSNDQFLTLTFTLISTAFSLFFSGIYYCIHSKQEEAVGTHAFSLTFNAQEFEPYMAHSHWRIQTAIQKGFALHSPSQVIIDQCISLNNGMKIEGRLLGDQTAVNRRISVAVHDVFPKKSQTNERSVATPVSRSVTQNGKSPHRDETYLNKLNLKEIEIKCYLRKEFCFTNANAECSLTGLIVREINGGHGEHLYYHDTSAKKCCLRLGRCTHLCLYGCCHRCCPKCCCKKPKRRTQSNFDPTVPTQSSLPPISESNDIDDRTNSNNNEIDNGPTAPRPFSTWQTYENYGENDGMRAASGNTSAAISVEPSISNTNNISQQNTTNYSNVSTPATTMQYGIPKTKAEINNEGNRDTKLGINMLFADVAKEKAIKEYNETHLVHESNLIDDGEIGKQISLSSKKFKTKAYSNSNADKYKRPMEYGYHNQNQVNSSIDDAIDRDNIKRWNSNRSLNSNISNNINNNNNGGNKVEDRYEQLLKERMAMDDDMNDNDDENIPKMKPPPVTPIITQNKNNNNNNNNNIRPGNRGYVRADSMMSTASGVSISTISHVSHVSHVSGIDNGSGVGSVASAKNMWEQKASPRPSPRSKNRPPPPPPPKKRW